MASTHKHIRSGTANKRPTTAIADGQIALNTNLSSPGLFFKDSTGAEILKIGPVHVGATAPNVSPAGSAGNSTGEVWLDTSLTPVGVKIWNGSAFVNATPIGSTTVQGLLELATDAETQAGADTARAVTSASLQSKLSDSTSTTSATTIASSTAVKAAYDLANAALPKAGGTVTGNLEIGTAGSLSFEGATADGFETTIAVVDPTADRTITLPNTTGTVVTTGDTGTVTSTMLLDGTILNEDINASASIAYSKLATLTSGNIVLGSSANVATSTAVTGDVTITNAGVTAISAGVIVNADVNASAAIAGSKVAPDFGAQNIVTTGSSTAATFNPTGTTAPVTGVYSPGANRLGITTNSVERVEFGTSEVVFNDDAADYDFRIEGDTNSNLFFADASAEAVGIRTATPVSEFNVSVGNGGNITISNTNDAHSAGLAFGDTTSNSSGRITYDHSTNALAISTNGTGRLFVNSSGSVGVGTSSPSTLLHVSGPTGTTFTLDGANDYSSTAAILMNHGRSEIRTTIAASGGNPGGSLLFRTRNTSGSLVDAVTIDSSQRVGIGTTGPSQALHVIGNIQVGDSGNERGIYVGAAGFSGAFLYRSSGDVQLSPRSGYGLTFAPAPGSATEWGRWDSSGRLLVGTSTTATAGNSQYSLLQVKGGSGLTAAVLSLTRAQAAASISNGSGIGSIAFGDEIGNPYAYIACESDAASGASDFPGRLVFSTTADGASSPTERMRIRANGEVVTTSSFNVSYTGISTGTMTYDAQTGASNAGLLVMTGKGNDGAGIGGVSLSRSAGSWSTYSDERAKTDLIPIENGLTKVATLRAATGRYLADEPGISRSFLIAQDVQAVLPEAVDAGDPDKLNLRYTEVIPLLVAALKESKERIETLEASNTDLLARVSALESA